MITNTITLHNFMSYADARIDLRSIDVACLSGRNGAGKSALLDAVTWALWECARSSSDELIRLGQSEMWVSVTFELDGQQYLVRRSRQRTFGRSGSRGTSKGFLDFQIVDSDESQRTSLTASTMRETQERICQILRMDYDTFVNSVYLRQGKADEFTTKAPSERKQVLSEILGLSYFDRLQELAKENARDVRAKIEALESSAADLPAVEASLAESEREAARVAAELAEAKGKAAFFEERLESLSRQMHDIQLAEQRLASGRDRYAELESDAVDLRQRHEQLTGKLAELAALIDQGAKIELEYRRLQAVRDEVEKFEQSFLSIQELNARKREIHSELAMMRSRIEVDLDHWRSMLKELMSTLSSLERETGEVSKVDIAYRQYKDLLVKEAELSSRQDAHYRLTQRAESLQKMIAEARIRLEAEIEQKQAAVAELEMLLASEPKLTEEQKALVDKAEFLDKLEAEFELVEEKGLALRSKIEQAQIQIEQLRLRQGENEEKIRELEHHADSSICPLCASPIVDRLAVIERYREQIRAAESEIAALEADIGQMENERQELRRRYAELKLQLDSRKELDKHIGQFNERQEAIARARASLKDLTGEVEQLSRALAEQNFALVERESLISVKAEIHKIAFDPAVFAALQGQIRAQRHVEVRFHQLQKDMVSLEKVKASVPELTSKVLDAERRIAKEEYGEELRQEILELEAKASVLSYDRDRHLKLKNELVELTPISEQYRDLERARTDRPVVEEELAACQASLRSKSEQMSQLTVDLALSQAKVEDAESVKIELDSLAPSLAEYKARRDQLTTDLAVIESRRQSLAGKMRELEGLAQQTATLKQTMDDYLILAEAFGKKGIQAVIIENSVPEIESESNRILSRLSDNQMHVALKTQHKTKAGGIVETLEIMIGDEIGTRNYELYSGGEAFKVDFAIRVALSRLLARRSGAKLETLIIDEGFGSQDEVSRDRLVRAIASIQPDFARILVVTHINEIKEMFPRQLLVTKNGGISQVEMLG